MDWELTPEEIITTWQVNDSMSVKQAERAVATAAQKKLITDYLFERCDRHFSVMPEPPNVPQPYRMYCRRCMQELKEWADTPAIDMNGDAR